jgi:hypothetical protein
MSNNVVRITTRARNLGYGATSNVEQTRAGLRVQPIEALFVGDRRVVADDHAEIGAILSELRLVGDVLVTLADEAAS